MDYHHVIFNEDTICKDKVRNAYKISSTIEDYGETMASDGDTFVCLIEESSRSKSSISTMVNHRFRVVVSLERRKQPENHSECPL